MPNDIYEGDGLYRPTPPPYLGEPLRLLAQKISGEWLSWELPATEIEITHTLSGPSVISGKLEPESVEVRELGIQPWGVWIHCEMDGEIRASGLLQPGSLEDETLSFSAEGTSAYPHGMIYMGSLSQVGIGVGDVVRNIWAHLQSFDNGDLGVTVEGTTNTHLGTPKKKDNSDSGPYVLAKYNATDCGEEIKKLCEQAKVDFREVDAWNADRSAVTHKIVLEAATGKKRDDLRFASGENILEQPTMPAYADYANVVLFSGAGEGTKRVQATSSVTVPGQLRRMAAIDDSTVTKSDRAKALADIELKKRVQDMRFDEIVVDARHPNATYGSYHPGDHVLVEVWLPYLGDVALYHQVTAIKYVPAEETVTISLSRSDPPS